MTPNIPPTVPVGPMRPALSAQELAQLGAAAVAMRRLRRAASVARFDGWTIGIFAFLTFLCGMTDAVNIVLAIAMGTVAAVELRGAAGLTRLEPRAARMLGFNQLALGTVLLVYGGWRLVVVARGGVAELLGEWVAPVEELVGCAEMHRLARNFAYLLYSSLCLIAILGQGGMALYYFSRAKVVEAYLTATPEWVLEMQRAGVTV